MTRTQAHTKYIGLDGVQVPGTTTVLGILNKPFLVPWANKLGLQGIDSTKYKDKMADIGTLAHLFIMNHLRGEKTDTGDFTGNDIKLAENCFASYLAWEKSHTIKPILIEKPIVSDKYGYGGTPDCVGYLDDELVLIDFKTGKALWPEHTYQLAAYRQLSSEQNYHITQGCLLRIGRNDNEGFEEKTIKRFDREFELFLHCLAIYNIKKDIAHEGQTHKRQSSK